MQSRRRRREGGGNEVRDSTTLYWNICIFSCIGTSNSSCMCGKAIVYFSFGWIPRRPRKKRIRERKSEKERKGVGDLFSLSSLPISSLFFLRCVLVASARGGAHDLLGAFLIAFRPNGNANIEGKVFQYGKINSQPGFSSSSYQRKNVSLTITIAQNFIRAPLRERRLNFSLFLSMRGFFLSLKSLWR